MNFKGLLRCKGKYIVDSEDNPYLLRGLGIGGYLVREGYMLHSFAPSPSTIEAAIIDLIGEKSAKIFFKKYEENFFNENDVKALAKLGFNSVRIPFHYKSLSPSKGKYLKKGFETLDMIINWCMKHDLYVILDMHCAPGSQNGQNISDDLSGDAKLYSQADKYHKWCEDIWKKIASRYKDNDYIAGYDLINEPVLTNDLTYEDLRKSYIQLTKAVRSVDTRHMIFIEGAHYATKIEGLTPKFDENMVYAFHKYWNSCDVGAIRKFLELRDNENAPIYLGETGENANGWFYANIKLMESLNIGWNWWTHKKIDNITQIYNILPSQGYQEILDYWHFKGPKPTLNRAKKILNGLLENIKIENCEFKVDVYHALMDVNNDSTVPYKKHILPCQINLADYDIGKPNIAYGRIDAMRDDLKKIGGNRARKYRNDGIDIYEVKNCPVVCLNCDGQWQKYTVEVIKKAEYQFNLELIGRGRVELQVNNKSVTQSFETSSYQTYEVASFNLDIGQHIIYLRVVEKGLCGKQMIIKVN